MTSSTPRLWVLLPSLLGLASLRCSVGGVGDPCIPEDEYQSAFSGYSVEETNVESRSFQCETRVCLVNHFQGRVSCPYGMLQTDIGTCRDNFAANQEKCCKIPGTVGGGDDAVIAAVSAQKKDRRPDRAVYCSCRCANVDGKTNDGASYCDCPSGYKCTQLIPNLQLGELQLAGSYCIKAGTEFKATDKAGVECANGGCGPAQPN